MKPAKLKDYLDKKFSKKEKEFLPSSFDIIGNIVIVDIKDEILKKEKIIGEALLEMHKNVYSVYRRAGEHSGKFRTQKMKWIAGKRNKETVHKESGCNLRLNVEKCYFSPRSGTERLRIAGQIKKKENILVMFSGIGPYVCVIGKNCDYGKIVGVELNKAAHEYAKVNVEKNKIKNVELYHGDVRKIVPKLEKFDRIVMPLPRTAEEFLDTALKVAKKGTMIHLYGFLGEDEFDNFKKEIKQICDENNVKIRIKGLVKCGQFSPRIYRVCVDFRVM